MSVESLNEILGEMGEPPTTAGELLAAGLLCTDCGSVLEPVLERLAALRCHDCREAHTGSRWPIVRP